MTIVPPTPEGMAAAAAVLCASETVAYPTETVYGLAVDPFSETAIQRLFDIKGRDSANAVLLIVADDAQLAEIVEFVSPRARACIRAFWPGPLSLLLPKSARLPDALAAGSQKIGVRLPASAVARDLCRTFGHAVTSTSANRSGRPPAAALEDVRLDGVSLGIDGGRLPPSAPSTVYDPETDTILRTGKIPIEAIARAIRSEIAGY